MKKLILAAIIFASCGNTNDSTPNRTATIVITTDSTVTFRRTDTVTVEYYKELYIQYNALRDGNDNVLAEGVSQFNILKSESIK